MEQLMSIEELIASLQTIMSSLITNINGAYKISRRKYKKNKQDEYNSQVAQQKIYVQEFAKSFLELVALMKNIEDYPKLKINKEHLHWIEAYAGHIYQQFHDEFLPILSEEVKVDDKVEFALQKKWEKNFWATIQASIDKMADKLSEISDTFKGIKVKRSDILPKLSFARFFASGRSLGRSLSKVAFAIYIMIHGGCGSETDDMDEITNVVSSDLFQKADIATVEGVRFRLRKGQAFLYRGDIKPNNRNNKIQISRAFDNWDHQQGDLYADTGWGNVHIDGGNVFIIAKPNGNRPPDPSNNPVGATLAAGFDGIASVGSPEERALLDTIAFAEGVREGRDGYHTMFGGGRFRNLSRHPRRIISAGGLRSSAAGRYQFMPDTWDSIPRRYRRNMRPRSQDRAALYLAMNRRGVTRNMLRIAIRTNNFSVISRHLFREWASIRNPRTGRGAYRGQRRGRGTLQALNAVFQHCYRVQFARNRGVMNR